MRLSTRTLTEVAITVIAALSLTLSAGFASAKDGSANQIREIKVSQKAGQTTISVVGSVRPTFTAFKLSTPQRLVVDLANSQVKGVPSVIEAATDLVDGVAVSQYSTGGIQVSRVMVNFRKEAAYRVRAKGNKLIITMTGGPAKAGPAKVDSAQVEQEIARAKAEAKAEAEQEIAAARARADKEVAAARAKADSEIARAEAADC